MGFPQGGRDIGLGLLKLLIAEAFRSVVLQRQDKSQPLAPIVSCPAEPQHQLEQFELLRSALASLQATGQQLLSIAASESQTNSQLAGALVLASLLVIAFSFFAYSLGYKHGLARSAPPTGLHGHRPEGERPPPALARVDRAAPRAGRGVLRGDPRLGGVQGGLGA